MWKEIAEDALTSTEFVNKTGNELKPIIRNLLLSNVHIPINFKLLTLFTDGATGKKIIVINHFIFAKISIHKR